MDSRLLDSPIGRGTVVHTVLNILRDLSQAQRRAPKTVV